MEKIAEVLKVIQTFDPIGVGAVDLRQSLMQIQLERKGQQETSNTVLSAISWRRSGKCRIPEIVLRGTSVANDIDDAQESS